MFKWLAQKRFNYVDIVFNAYIVVCIVQEQWWNAVITFIIGILVGIIVELCAGTVDA